MAQQNIEERRALKDRMRERVAARVPAGLGLFTVLAVLSAIVEWNTFPERRPMIVAVDVVLAVMVLGALALVRFRRAWSTPVMVLCTNLVAFILTGYHAVNGASAEGCLLMLAGLLATVALLFPWGWRAQAAASATALLTYPIALANGAVPALAPVAGIMFLSIVVALSILGAELVVVAQMRIDDLEASRSELATAREEIRDREAQLRQVLDLVPHMVFAKDAHGTLLLVNQAVADAYGSTVEALTGANHADLHGDPAELAAMLTDDREVIASGRPKFIQEEPFVDAAGRRRRLQTIKIPYVEPGRSEPAVLGVAVDITALQRAEEQRRRLEGHVFEAEKLESLGVLAGGIAHDFNNLLVGILGNASLALDTIDAGGDCRRFLTEVEKAGRRASELCNQMLACSGRGRVAAERFDLSAVVSDVAGLLRASISKKATLHVDWGSDLPAVEGDATQIRQIAMNLVTNASDALGPAGGTIAVRTRVLDASHGNLANTVVGEGRREGAYVCLEVSDNGSGMSDQTIARMFDPFFTTKFAGRGLGLSAVLGITKSHHGTIDVESAPGRGTTVRVLLPVASGAPADPPAAEAMEPQEQAEGGRVLVVDDEEVVRSVTKEALELRGFDVLLAEDGRKALDVLGIDGDGIGLVILDMTMPRLDGEETLHGLRRVAPDIPVLLMSGYTEDDTATRVHEGNVVGFLQKPFRIPDLLTKVTAAVKRRDDVP